MARVRCEADGCDETARLPRGVYGKHYDEDKGRAVWWCKEHR